MEMSKAFLALISGVCLVVTTAVLTMYLTQQYACDMRIDVTMPDDSMEFLERYHDPEKQVTAIMGAAAEKCYILFNDQNPTGAGRAFRIAPEQFSEEILRTTAGAKIIEFCEGLDAVPVELVSEEELTVREKRQDSRFDGGRQDSRFDGRTPARGRGHTQVDFEKVRRTQDRLTRNQCQNEVLVDCGGKGGVYECVTGPGEVYRAKTQCQTATQFSFNLASRCKEFPKTERFRFIKCLQAFILGTHQ